MPTAEQSDKPGRDTLEEWARQVRVTIRGIDGQAKRRTHRSHRNGITEDVIDGYELNTGLWHRLLGLLACCPAPEAAATVPECGDTPRTEKLHRQLHPESALSSKDHYHGTGQDAVWELARQLERELNAARSTSGTSNPADTTGAKG